MLEGYEGGRATDSRPASLVIDLRIWRIALLAVPVAVVVAMFSLQEVPDPREPALAPDAFEGPAAASLIRELTDTAPDPRAGSESDAAIAELVNTRFSAIAGAETAEQRFEVDGKDLRNLIAILPGSSERQVAVIAHRDTESGTGVTSSIAATAMLLELASSFSGSTHEKTLVFVSTDGGSLGAAGARRFIEDYTDAGLIDAVVVISQPAFRLPEPPLVVPWSTGPQSLGIGLAETANATVSRETGQQAGHEGPLQELFRLALPAGLGEQAPLIEHGVDAVRISSSGELPPSPEQDRSSEISTGSIDRFGRAALALVLALDNSPGPLEQGSDAYVGLAGNLLPGWSLALIALALLLPVAAVAAEGLGSSARSPLEAARSLWWVVRASLPFLASLFVLYLLDLFGVVPDPPFPFDPRAQELGVSGRLGVLGALAVLVVGFWMLRPLRPPPARASAAAPPAALALAGVWVLVAWFVNPYLALLLALGLNVWVFAALPSMPGRLAAFGVILLGLVPLLVAIGDLAGRLGGGNGIVRDLVLMLTDGQIGLGLAILGCLLAGSATALVALSGPAGPLPPPPEIRIRAPRLTSPIRLRRRSRRRPRDREPRGQGPDASEPGPGEAERKPDPSVYW
jgi:hypothetical protein